MCNPFTDLTILSGMLSRIVGGGNKETDNFDAAKIFYVLIGVTVLMMVRRGLSYI